MYTYTYIYIYRHIHTYMSNTYTTTSKAHFSRMQPEGRAVRVAGPPCEAAIYIYIYIYIEIERERERERDIHSRTTLRGSPCKPEQ